MMTFRNGSQSQRFGKLQYFLPAKRACGILFDDSDQCFSFVIFRYNVAVNLF